jgi:hypothetical protein
MIARSLLAIAFAAEQQGELERVRTLHLEPPRSHELAATR